MKKVIGIATMVVLAISLSACGSSSSGKERVMISGSSSVNVLMEELEPVFEAKYETIDLKISASGSSDGIKAAKEGTVDFGMSSRSLTPEEKSGVDETIIAMDGISVIVNPSNPVNDLTIEQIAQIYKGEITNWSEVGGADLPIAVVSRESASGTRGAFEEILGIKDQMTTDAKEFNGTGGVKSEVSQNPNAIGYISIGAIDETVQPMKVDGIEASEENIKNESYAIARPFILIYEENSLTDASQTFLDWVMSAEGQEVVAEDFVSVENAAE